MVKCSFILNLTIEVISILILWWIFYVLSLFIFPGIFRTRMARQDTGPSQKYYILITGINLLAIIGGFFFSRFLCRYLFGN